MALLVSILWVIAGVFSILAATSGGHPIWFVTAAMNFLTAAIWFLMWFENTQ